MSRNDSPIKVTQMVRVEGDVNNGIYEVSHVSFNGAGWDVLLKGVIAIVPHTMLIPA